MSNSDAIRILYMEDNEKLADLFKLTLEGEGYIVDTALNGKEGISMVDNKIYDVVVVDHKMPVYDGIEVIRILKTRDTFPPTIMITGAGDEEIAVQAMKLGVSDYVVKDAMGKYLDLVPSLIKRVLQKHQLIIEKQQAEEALKESERRYRELVENIEDIVYIIDTEGKIVFLNKALERASGYNRDELINKKISDYLTPDSVKFVRNVFKKGLAKDDVGTFELEFYDKAGKIKILEIRPRFVWEDGKIVETHGIGRDITEKRRLELQIIRAENLSSLGIMVSGVAHELKNPLASIVGAAEILMDKDQLEETREKGSEIIQRESERCKSIINGLETFAMKNKPDRSNIDVNEVIQNSLKTWDEELSRNSIEVVLNIANDIPETSSDQYQLHQVFSIIINNAIDAISQKENGRLSINSTYDKDVIIIEFEDNGTGIPKNDIKNVFNPFFTTKEVGKGTGLGLSIAYGIVKEHNGMINVESEEGMGSKFIIELPAVKEM